MCILRVCIYVYLYACMHACMFAGCGLEKCRTKAVKGESNLILYMCLLHPILSWRLSIDLMVGVKSASERIPWVAFGKSSRPFFTSTVHVGPMPSNSTTTWAGSAGGCTCILVARRATMRSAAGREPEPERNTENTSDRVGGDRGNETGSTGRAAAGSRRRDGGER